LFSDHQGTQQIAVNAGTQAVTIRRQTPYGGARGGTTAWVNEKGFVGGDNDPTGQVNIGARQYDAVLGRFISVDPVMDLADPNQWNAYAYAYNSPVSHADPTGEDPCPGGGGGCYYDGTTTALDGVTKAQMDKGMELSRKYVKEIKQQKETERRVEEANKQQKAAAERARKQKECQASFWCRTKNKAKALGTGAMNFMAQHADVVGVIAGVGVGALCTVITGGSGALLCGALGGMARALVTDGLKCYGGDADRCSAKALLVDAAIGAGSGMLGAGVGGGLAAGGRAIFQGSSVLKTFGAGTVRGMFREAPKQLARTVGFVKGRISNFRTDAAVMGTKAVLKETAGWALKAGNTFDNYVGTFTGRSHPPPGTTGRASGKVGSHSTPSLRRYRRLVRSWEEWSPDRELSSGRHLPLPGAGDVGLAASRAGGLPARQDGSRSRGPRSHLCNDAGPGHAGQLLPGHRFGRGARPGRAHGPGGGAGLPPHRTAQRHGHRVLVGLPGPGDHRSRRRRDGAGPLDRDEVRHRSHDRPGRGLQSRRLSLWQGGRRRVAVLRLRGVDDRPWPSRLPGDVGLLLRLGGGPGPASVHRVWPLVDRKGVETPQCLM
jgi:RHS repeat-associated protein